MIRLKPHRCSFRCYFFVFGIQTLPISTSIIQLSYEVEKYVFFLKKKSLKHSGIFLWVIFCVASSSFYSKYFMSMLDVSSKLFLHFLNFFILLAQNKFKFLWNSAFLLLEFFSLSFTGYSPYTDRIVDMFVTCFSFFTSCVCKHTFDMLLFSKIKIRTFLQTLSYTKRWAFQVETPNSNDSQQFSHQFDKVSHEMPKQTFL